MSCDTGRKCGSDLLLLWPWCMRAARALIQPLAWELPYAIGGALKRKKRKNVTGCCRGAGVIPAQWVKGSGIATAAAYIQHLVQELTYAGHAAIKRNNFFFKFMYGKVIKTISSGHNDIKLVINSNI